jgi:integrase
VAVAKQTRRTLKPPAYRLHKGSGQARVRLNGEDIYLGKFGSDESKAKYATLIAERASPAAVAASKPGDAGQNLTVNEVILAFLKYAKMYYVKNGIVTDEYDCIKSAVRWPVKLYGQIPANEFGPLKLMAVRQAMIDSKKLCRSYINKSIDRIRRAFRYGVSREIVASPVLGQLESVTPLLAGRTEAIDHPKRKPVPRVDIDKVKAEVPERTADIMQLLLLTGARPGEIVRVTGAMLNRTEDVWIADLADHKTAHHDKLRVLIFCQQAQEILKKYLQADPDKKLFKVARSTVSNQITAACDKLKINRFSAHWLRHNAASWIREEFGLDVAQVMLGHSSASMTELYAHLSKTKAMDAARKIG